MSAPPAVSRHPLFTILLLCALLLTIGAAGWGALYNQTDGQYAGAAKIMARGGSWLIPENDGIPRLIKPPLLYWSMAGAMKIFGVNEFAARLPIALSIVAWVMVTFLIGARMGGAWRGFIAGCILLTSLGTFTLGRIIMPETLFAAFIALSLYCVLRGYDEEKLRRVWFAGFWLFGSLACFSKGWHGLLYPLGIVGAVALFNKEARPHLRGLISWQGAIIFVLINLPWHAYIEWKFPGYLKNLLLVEHLGHITGINPGSGGYTTASRSQFFLLHLAWFFPWSAIAGGILLAWFVQKGKEALQPLCNPRATPAFAALKQLLAGNFPAQIVIFWGVIVLVSALLTGQRQDYYAMVAWPAFALSVAWLLEKARLRPGILGVAGLVIVSLIPLILVGHILGQETADVAGRYTAWTTLSSMGASLWSRLAIIGFTVAGCLLASCVCGWVFEKNGCKYRAFFALFVGAIALDLGGVAGYAEVSSIFSVASAAAEIKQHEKPGLCLVYDGKLNVGSSLMFYADQPILLLDQDANANFAVQSRGIGRDRYLCSEEFIALWKSGKPLILITESRKLPEWQLYLSKSLTPMAQCGTQVLVRNFP